MKYLASAVIALIVTLVTAYTLTSNNPVGSINVGQEYQSTTTQSTSASATVAWNAFTGSGSLGSIVVSDDSATVFRVWDATSTATSTYSLDPSATYGRLIAQTEASLAETTLVYDVSVNYGLVVETPSGFTGIYTVTYKK